MRYQRQQPAGNAEETEMSTVQRNVFVVGISLMALFVFLQPIQYQSPIYIPITESVSIFQKAPVETIPMGPDQRKNMVAACITGAATIFGLYLFEERQPVLEH